MVDERTKIVPILAGGGTRLPAHVGVLAALEQLQIDFDHLVGVSGGSIVAALLAAGKGVEEIKALAMSVDFRRFRGFSLFHLFVNGGLSSGRSFEKWLRRQIDDITFADVPLGLHVVATDLCSGRPVVFNREETPETRLVEAVRCSMCIPLVFAYKEMNGQVLVDGSILAEEELQKNWSGTGDPVCFFRIRSLSKNSLRQGQRQRPSLPTFIVMLIRTFMSTMSREFIHDGYWNSTIIIDSGAYSPIEFSLSAEDKEALYRLGYETTLEYLPKKFFRHLNQ